MSETTWNIDVEVDLENDEGCRMTYIGSGPDVDHAIWDAEAKAAEISGDDSYVMTDWRAA